MEHVTLRVAQLERADDRRDSELALPDEGLRIDRQPRLPLRRQHVLAVEVLVQQHLLALRSGKLAQGLERGVEQLGREAPVLSRQVFSPPCGFVGKWPE